MDINDLRKQIFINSQYCNFYNEKNGTVLAGIMRSYGYKYSIILPDEKIKEINKTYRKFTAIMNALVAVEIILYIYTVIFPYYTEFIKMPYFGAVMMLAVIPLVALYLTYIAVNYLYENYLTRYIGTFKRVKFKPTLKNISEKAYEEYQKTPRYSVYVLGLLIIIFLSYVAAPFLITGLNRSGKYNAALGLANTYLTFVPVSSSVYAQRAYSNVKLKKYEKAVTDYENADKYSLSDVYIYDILGTKTYFLKYDEMLKEFDKAMNEEKSSAMRYLLKYEKTTYKLKNKHYTNVVNEYSELIKAYKAKKEVFFAAEDAYYNRGVAREATGDKAGGAIDKNIAKNMCPECEFNSDTTLIRKP